MSERPPNVVNIRTVPEVDESDGRPFRSVLYRRITPALEPRLGRLGANVSRLLPGTTSCPFHTHALADEVFFVLSGRGILRYGDTFAEIGPDDCIACPAGTGIAHQIGNPFDEDLVFLAIGVNHPDEVATYPDSGKVWVRRLDAVGTLVPRNYWDGEDERPRVTDPACPRTKPQ